MTQPSAQQIRSAVRLALDEDLSSGDVTTAALFPRPLAARGTVVAHHPMTVAGIAVAKQVFAHVDPALAIVRTVRDGARVQTDAPVLIVQGDARSLLKAERVALNFLQRLSGIATLTDRFCNAVSGYPARILDTRKTTPGLRALEKWAVSLGGGVNHRRSLGDGILIKDNHLALLRNRAGIAEACRLARTRRPRGSAVIVEVQSLDQVREALDGKADIILLDNMTPALVRKATALVKGLALIEVSGGITLRNVRAMAAAGADRISVGALTHSAPAANLSMDIAAAPDASRRSHKRGR
ncbi:MAG: carboxylating nicotinate-nucleotide diphosphorylase [Nitrospira sp.]|nr:carboxylating nicotinate-nucleotide diphosphorylase [Nitrospira sp.]